MKFWPFRFQARLTELDRLLDVLDSLITKGLNLMAALEDAIANVQTNLATLGTDIGVLGTKVDAIIASLKAQGVPQADLDALAAVSASASSMNASVQQMSANLDAANPQKP